METLCTNLFFWVVVPLVVGGVAYLLYYVLSLPLRRQERARLFLDLLDQGFRQGQSAERTIVGAAASGDTGLGARFHLLAAQIESGASLDEALRRVPRLLPSSVAALLGAAHQVGDVRALLPACRQRLEDGAAIVASAQHYFMMLLLGVGPAWVFLFWVFMVFIMPKFMAIAEDMGAPAPGPLVWMARHGPALMAVQGAIVFGFVALAWCYIGGPRLARWVDRVWAGLPDRVAWRVPWRRQRLQRDFSVMLAHLLDAGIPESRAVQIAAASTANEVVVGRAARVEADLAGGQKLPEALERMDPAGGFRWRLENAAHGSREFRVALEGWHEALTVEAYRLEQSSAQVLTTALVVLNGAFVGSLAVAVFGMLTDLVNSASLW